MVRKIILAISGVFILISMLCQSSLAAMDPAEVNRVNEDSPYQISGKVTADELVEDMTENSEHPIQLRKMTIQISKVIKAPESVKEDEYTNVYYHYIPKWDADEYVGGKRVDIAVHDVVTLWLKRGEFGWEPVLGGESVNHIEYHQDRVEHIPEPFVHSVMRGLDNYVEIRAEIFVLITLMLILIWAFYQGLRTKKI
ncbi:hypothetical protein [Ornithinibacillus scapharcae]|uniref:hypothetical protein n=1 Tax=Ornithinibacillus scapharcae TaxID=1147159 RepID=UPI000225B00D|nr:hypothetical protein [Ornithinibacillus scapharcae]